MAAPKGNRFWEARSTHGRNPKFKDAETLWSACQEYFKWNADNPLLEVKFFVVDKQIVKKELPKMRAMTLDGLTGFLDISRQTWLDYRKREDLAAVVARADEVIRQQKFEGAAAEMLNPGIIARALGLADKSELSGPGGGPIQTEVSARETLADRIADLATRKGTQEDTGESE